MREIFFDKPYLLKLCIDYEDGKTPEWRLAKEIDKVQVIEQARYYEDTEWRTGLTNEFYTYAVITKQQITTNFLLDYANQLNRS
jgi:hypothetical protein